MCNSCDDMNHTDEDTPVMGRRRAIALAGASLVAAPALTAIGSGHAKAISGASAGVSTGPSTVKAYGTRSTSQPVAAMDIQRRAVGPNDVLIDVLYAGICHSDVHTVRGDWGAPAFPCVPGHEIIGRVLAVGAKVTKFSPGEIAGVGCMVDACGTCENCLADREQICLNGTTFTYNAPDKVSGGHSLGGYSERIVVSERFAIRIPPGMDLASAAPILCAGITTFSPIRHWEVKPGQRVGVVGLGGLGHMAVKLAAAQRADVTIFTTSPGKVGDAARLGAKRAVLWNDPAALKPLSNSLDVIISTVPYPFEVQPLLDTLKLDATLVNVGLGEPRGLNPSAMAFGRKSLAGSMIGGIAETQEVIDHCFARNIRPDVELITPDQINAAFDRVVAKDVRYRFVIDFASGKAQSA
jgi:alcohol dehydrogenase (NADP+)